MLGRVSRVLSLIVLASVAAVVGIAAPAFADSGGGCSTTNGVSVCISVASGTSNPLLLDFYVNGNGLGECYADLAIIYNNTSNPPSHYLVSNIHLTHSGHYGAWAETKAIGSGQGKTLLLLKNCSLTGLYVAYSPNQSW